MTALYVCRFCGVLNEYSPQACRHCADETAELPENEELDWD